MKKFTFLLIVPLMALLIITSCKKDDKEDDKTYMTVDLPYLDIQDDYYNIDYNERSIELQFSSPVDTSTVRGNISFYDQDGNLDTCYSLVAYDDKVIMLFGPYFELQPGWQYLLDIKTGLRSVSGFTLGKTKTFDIRTSSLLLGDTRFDNSIICISDIHLGEERSVTQHYGWFHENQQALLNLLDFIINDDGVKQLVILGDLFDGWIIPYHDHVFDSSHGVNDIAGYFNHVANSSVNLPIINKLKTIASGGKTQLVYIPGNHDMLLTQSVLEGIIPGIQWQGDARGLGHYVPVEGIIMEHGHRFDLFNAPEPLINPNHILPPGFFISRLQAEVSKNNPSLLKNNSEDYLSQDFLFHVAWDIAIDYLEIKGNSKIHRDSMNIVMDRVDGYNDKFSFNSARAMYDSCIEKKWGITQIQNQVPIPISVGQAIFDSDVDLDITAKQQYMEEKAPVKYKIVVMGHTHKPELEYYTPLFTHQGIYANTGSWVDQKIAEKKQVRTFIVIQPAKWTKSAIDVVSLYQSDQENIKWTLLKNMSIKD